VTRLLNLLHYTNSSTCHVTHTNDF